MIGTLLWRLKTASRILLGKKETADIKSDFPPQSLETLEPVSITDNRHAEFLKNHSIEFIFSEFKEERVNAGGANFSHGSRLDPSLSSLKAYFPDAKFTVYSDFDLNIDGVDLKKVETPVLQDKKDNPRHYYHLADYYKFKGMLDSEADIAIAIDSDMWVWNENIYTLPVLAEKFGFCVPASSGKSLNFEIATSLDTVPVKDDSKGFGQTCNITPMALAKHSKAGRIYFQACCDILEREPSRASIVMWKASWDTGISPYFLPKEFCVVRGLEGMGNEVLLHLGHKSVADFYNVKV